MTDTVLKGAVVEAPSRTRRYRREPGITLWAGLLIPGYGVGSPGAFRRVGRIPTTVDSQAAD